MIQPTVKAPHSGRLSAQSSFHNAQRMVVVDDEFAAVSEGRIRIRIGAALFVMMLCVVMVRLIDVSVLTSGDAFSSVAKTDTTPRADITDRDGRILATNIETYLLYAEPRQVIDVQAAAEQIARVLPSTRAEKLMGQMSQNMGMVYLARGLTPKERQRVFDLGLPGIEFRVEPKRIYPRRSLASYVVGMTDPDLNGTAGSEKAFDDELTSLNVTPKVLSLDLRVQHAVSDELADGLAKFKAKANTGIVLNIKTGEVIAMASLPNFDPNQPNTFSKDLHYNHATISTYDLGSVFKPITMAMALDNNVTTIEELFPVQAPVKVRNKVFHDDHPSKEPLAMPDILAQSSNRGTVMIAMRAGGDMQREFLRSVGLFDRAPIELSESVYPQVQSEWQDITTATVSYGHGISVTPLALASAIGAILNDGVYVPPTVSRRDRAPVIGPRRVISSETSKTMQDLMRYVVTHGTGKHADVPGYGVMGKTGTADKPSIGGYDERRLVTSFVAAYPHNDPTYVVMVTYDEPKAVEGTHGYATAGWNAAPTVKKIIERIGPILGGVNRGRPHLSKLPNPAYPSETTNRLSSPQRSSL